MIRRAQEKDTKDILNLLIQVDMVHHNGRPDLFKGPATKYTAEQLCSMYSDDSRPIFVFEKDGSVAGYAFCIFVQHTDDNVLTDVKTLYIDDICVDENCRGMHVGKALYDYVLNFARHSGCYNVTLNVWSCNPGAMKFYEKCGLKPQKICMEKLL
jgi:ribosomal protein S18 acetylase RimI-like enzyme